MFHITSQDPATPEALDLVEQLSNTLASITGDSGRSSFDPDDVRGPRALFVVARDIDGVAVLCGAFCPLQGGVAEVKRMYAQPGTRGVGSAVLGHLEEQAALMGYTELWFETRRCNVRAASFYERRGYRQNPNFGKYLGRPEAVCLGKMLAAAPEALLVGQPYAPR